MIKTLLSSDLTPQQLLTTIKKLDMTVETKQLATLHHQNTDSLGLYKRANILNSTNTHTGTLTLYYNDTGNISLKVPDNAPVSPMLYSIPGSSVLFAINAESYRIRLYEIEDDILVPGPVIIIDAQNPFFVDGSKFLYESNPDGKGHLAFIGSINFPDNSADIQVFERTSLRKIAWFPHDNSTARYLVALELLLAVKDPGAGKVAEELIYHYHPAVAWKTFQLLHDCDPERARRYVPQLRRMQNPRLDRLLAQHLGEVA